MDLYLKKPIVVETQKIRHVKLDSNLYLIAQEREGGNFERREVYDLRFYNKLRIQYKVATADSDFRDRNFVIDIANGLQSIVDFVSNISAPKDNFSNNGDKVEENDSQEKLKTLEDEIYKDKEIKRLISEFKLSNTKNIIMNKVLRDKKDENFFKEKREKIRLKKLQLRKIELKEILKTRSPNKSIQKRNIRLRTVSKSFDLKNHHRTEKYLKDLKERAESISKTRKERSMEIRQKELSIKKENTKKKKLLFEKFNNEKIKLYSKNFRNMSEKRKVAEKEKLAQKNLYHLLKDKNSKRMKIEKINLKNFRENEKSLKKTIELARDYMLTEEKEILKWIFEYSLKHEFVDIYEKNESWNPKLSDKTINLILNQSKIRPNIISNSETSKIISRERRNCSEAKYFSSENFENLILGIVSLLVRKKMSKIDNDSGNDSKDFNREILDVQRKIFDLLKKYKIDNYTDNPSLFVKLKKIEKTAPKLRSPEKNILINIPKSIEEVDNDTHELVEPKETERNLKIIVEDDPNEYFKEEFDEEEF